MIVRDISSLVCPSVQILRIYSAIHRNYLCECVNEGWNSAEEFEGTRPKPDYSVGSGRSAFTQEQLRMRERTGWVQSLGKVVAMGTGAILSRPHGAPHSKSRGPGRILQGLLF